MYPETLREDVHGLLGLAKETARLALARFADVDDVEQVFGRAEIVDAPVSNWCVRVHERFFDCFDVLAKSLVGVPPVRDGALRDLGRVVRLIPLRTARDDLHVSGQRIESSTRRFWLSGYRSPRRDRVQSSDPIVATPPVRRLRTP